MANILYGEKPIISLIFMIILSLQFDDVNTILLFFTLLTEKRLYRSRIPIQPALILLIQLR